MDAVKFIQERDRMCHFYHDASGCHRCLAKDCECSALECMVDDDNIVAIVEKWSAAHPRKTRQSVFLEQYPTAKIVEGALAICPYNLGLIDKCKSEVERLCSDCRREFWMQEVK